MGVGTDLSHHAKDTRILGLPTFPTSNLFERHGMKHCSIIHLRLKAFIAQEKGSCQK